MGYLILITDYSAEYFLHSSTDWLEFKRLEIDSSNPNLIIYKWIENDSNN